MLMHLHPYWKFYVRSLTKGRKLRKKCLTWLKEIKQQQANVRKMLQSREREQLVIAAKEAILVRFGMSVDIITWEQTNKNGLYLS
jgi:hypothetical protein